MIATVARLLCRELTLQNEYLPLENQVLKEEVSRRVRFTDEERRPLMRMSSARETALRAQWGTDEFLDSTAAARSQGCSLFCNSCHRLPFACLSCFILAFFCCLSIFCFCILLLSFFPPLSPMVAPFRVRSRAVQKLIWLQGCS